MHKRYLALVLILACLAAAALNACGSPIAGAEPTDTQSTAATTILLTEGETFTENETAMEEPTDARTTTSKPPTAASTRPGTTASTRPSAAPTTTGGGQIPFSIGVQVNTHGSTGKPDRVEIIRSKAALQTFYNKSSDPNKEALLQPKLARYDDAFFAERALVLITRTEPSGSIRHEVRSVSLQGDLLVVILTRSLPEMQTMDMAHWVIALEVRKDDIADAARVAAAFQDTGDRVRLGLQ